MRNDLKLAAFRIQRRCIAGAVFVGTHLGFRTMKQLAADQGKAAITAIGFVAWILESHDIDSVALESLDKSQDTMRAGIHRAVEQALRERGVSIQCVPTSELLSGFAYLTKASRQDMRQIVAGIWPLPNTRSEHPARLDALGLGLYCQTDRLLQ